MTGMMASGNNGSVIMVCSDDDTAFNWMEI